MDASEAGKRQGPGAPPPLVEDGMGLGPGPGPTAPHLLPRGAPRRARRPTLRGIGERGPVRLREAEPTPDGNLLADLAGEVGDPAELAAALDAIPGVVGHGLFDPSLVSDVLVGGEPGGVRRLPDPR